MEHSLFAHGFPNPRVRELVLDQASHLLAIHFGGEDALDQELVYGRDLQVWGESMVQALASGWPESEALVRWMDWAQKARVSSRRTTYWPCSFAVHSASALAQRLQFLDGRMNTDFEMSFREQSGVLSRRMACHPELVKEFADEAISTKSNAVLCTLLALLRSGGARCVPFRGWLHQRAEELAQGAGRSSRFGTDYTYGVDPQRIHADRGHFKWGTEKPAKTAACKQNEDDTGEIHALPSRPSPLPLH